MLLNLANNALKFTEAGEVRIAVTAASRTDKAASLLFEVSDTGIGMTEAQRSRLFQPFSQADYSTTRKFGGTGLGLAISQSLVELMGGEIEAVSESGHGSTFSFTLAFEHSTLTALDSNEAAATAERTDSEESQNNKVDAFDGFRLLLVEDNEINQIVAHEILQSSGMWVDIAENGQIALDKVRLNRYDAILMDLQMPVMDGFEATKQIRGLPGGDRIPIIAMTADAMDGVKKEVLAAGMQTYVAKPFEPSQLFRILSSLRDV
ncbi:ATP-binding protein [Cohnella yongneupensis]|uniref:histidine kinase n=1 Tax=Cohnella yongneupensis TaxID=425006 RepID=A0ABW0QTN2_9BACL